METGNQDTHPQDPPQAAPTAEEREQARRESEEAEREALIETELRKAIAKCRRADVIRFEDGRFIIMGKPSRYVVGVYREHQQRTSALVAAGKPEQAEKDDDALEQFILGCATHPDPGAIQDILEDYPAELDNIANTGWALGKGIVERVEKKSKPSAATSGRGPRR